MTIRRREFLMLASAAAAGAAPRGQPSSGPEDPLGVRPDFPAARRGVYLNGAYICPTPLPVERAAAAFARSKSRDPISLDDMLSRTDEVRGSFARLVGAQPEEIGFLYATSEGENLVARALDLQPGDNVVVDELHYLTTFVLYEHLEEKAGIELRIAKARDGAVRAEDFEPLVDRKTRLVSVAWVSHQNGYRHDLRSLAELAHARGAYLYTDAVQAAGMFPMSLREEGVDFLTTGTYKWLLAGYGVAPFFVRGELLDRIPPDRMGALHVESTEEDHRYRLFRAARKFEYATLAFGAVYQLGAAIDYLERVGLSRIESHTVGLAARLRAGLAEQGFHVLTPPENRSAIVSFVHGKDPDEARELVERSQVQVSFREDGTQIRAGVALFNNAADVERFLAVTEELRELGP